MMPQSSREIDGEMSGESSVGSDFNMAQRTSMSGTSQSSAHFPAPGTQQMGSNESIPQQATSSSDEESSGHDGPNKQPGHTSPIIPDRVFPIRSVVSVNPKPTPLMSPGQGSGENGGFPGLEALNMPSTSASAMLGRKSSQCNAASERISSPASSGQQLASPSTSSVASGEDDKMTSAVGLRRDRKTSRAGKIAADAIYGGGTLMQLFSDVASERSNESKSITGSGSTQGGLPITRLGPGESQYSGTLAEENTETLITSRFKHVVTNEGHAIITGRDGETLQRCEDEPIHIPGAIQGFGLLIALREDDEGQLIVHVVSENSTRIIGYSPDELFKMKCFTEILSEEQTENLLDHVDFIRDEDTDPAINGPEVFTISIRSKKKRGIKLWCAIHINPAHADVIVCEFELEDDQLYPLVPPADAILEPPENTLHSQPTVEELSAGIQNRIKPLRMLRSARKRKGEAAAMEVFNVMSQVQEQLSSAPNLDIFLKILVGVVKELTGFHRVMIYQFDSKFNGRVVTELVDSRATKDLYTGLNFPASDIPKQARDLYKINRVRLLYDRDLVTARLVCRTPADLEHPLDLTHSYLRAMSPIHIKYLANMAVRSSMSISINVFNELWGLVSCHAYGQNGMRVSFPIRKMCRLIGDTASRNIERLSYASRLQARKLINTVPTEANPSGYIIASSDDLLKLFDADFGLLSIRGETKVLGKLDDTQEALVMLEYLRLRNITSVLTSQDIREDFPDLIYAPGFNVIAGLLLVPLSAGGIDFIVFFRKGQTKEVKWAGNPYEKFLKEGTEGYLEPRTSFKIWKETVVGKCRDWTEEQIETAAVLCLVYGKFIEVWRQKEAALQSSQLTRLLLANSAHEVRTPLNAIINYLEIALEGSLDQETRENLAKSHSASKSLIYVINDLLDLTKTEEGLELVRDEIFDFPETIREATDIFKGDAKRKGIQYEVIEHPGIPRLVHGDQRRVRQAVANVTANAMQNTTQGSVKVQLWLAERDGRRVAIDIVVEDTGAGMSNQKLDALFRDLEQVSSANEDHLFPTSESQSQITEGKEDRALGLGLAIVARIVRNMDGQLRLKSEEGKGSRFVIQLPFEIPRDSPQEIGHEEGRSSLQFASQSLQSPAPVPLGEVMLVDKASSTRVEAISRKRSLEDMLSVQSFKSGSSARSGNSKRSDVDRLINAISEPLPMGRQEPDESRLVRSNSKGSGTSKKTAGSIGAGSAVSKSESHKERSTPHRAHSSNIVVSPEHLLSSLEGPPGSGYVQDSRSMSKAVRIPDELSQSNEQVSQHNTPSRVLFDIPNPSEGAQNPKHQAADQLQVLVAEDDPINSRIIKKRLEKAGHEVFHTVNGEDCAAAYGENPALFDVILMDMQMPIVDGLSSTKMIRSYEKTHPVDRLSLRAAANGRVPILAVSASLVERERQTYINAGFDGWVLKPIDFNRLNILLSAILDEKTRTSCLYQPGEWERGGFFERKRTERTRLSIDTALSGESLATHQKENTKPLQPDKPSLASDSSGSCEGTGGITPVNKPRQPFIHDERQDPTTPVASDSPPSNPDLERVRKYT